MKRKNIRIASLIMTIAMCFSICSPGFAVSTVKSTMNTTDSDIIRTLLGEEAMQQIAEQERAVEAYHYFCKHFRENSGDGITHVFPDNYAGEYILGEKLYINYVDSYENLKMVFGEKYADIVVFKEVEYSHNDLQKALNEISHFIPKSSKITCRISNKENRLIVSMDDGVLQTYSELSKARQSLLDAVRFEPYQGNSAPSTLPLKGGDKLSPTRTLSICGTHEGLPVIISCGHNGVNQKIPVGTEYTLFGSSTTAATVITSVYGNNISGDYSIAVVNTNNYHTTNQATVGLNYGGSNTVTINCVGADLSFAEGQFLIKYGAVGFGALISVLSTSSNVTYQKDNSEPWLIRDLVTTAVESGTNEEGDSGGTILRCDSSTGNYYYCGVISGNHRTNDIVDQIHFTPYARFSNSVTIRTS